MKTKKATASLRRKTHMLKQIKIALAQERDYLADSDEELIFSFDDRHWHGAEFCHAIAEIQPQ